jgi:hypothetical protein
VRAFRHVGYDNADQLTAAILKTTDARPAILKRLYDYISTHYGKGQPVKGEYYCDADDDKVIAFALARKADPKRKPYSWMPFKTNTCVTFPREAIAAGR